MKQVHDNSIQDAIRALYMGLEPTQLAIYHRVAPATALRIWNDIHLEKKQEATLSESECYKFLFAQGGFRSGKTWADCVRQLVTKLTYANHDSVVVRKHHEELRNSYIKDFKDMIDAVTGGNPHWLILDERSDDGAVELLIRSPGKPSRIIFKIEPEGGIDKIKNAFKYTNLADFTAEEANALQKTTVNMLISRLSRNDVPVGGSILTNPCDHDKHWIAVLFAQYQNELSSGARPFMVPVLCKTKDIEKHLPATYIPTMKELYKDDPVGLAMALEGTTGALQVGKPCFQGFFFEHHIDPTLRFDINLPLYRCWDFGRRVGAVGYWQLRKNGSAYKLAEQVCDNCTVEAFSDDVMSYTAQHFQLAHTIIDCGDPAGLQEKDTGQTIRVIQNRHKIHMRTMFHGTQESGLNHMRALLSESRDGQWRLSYHPRCTITTRAMQFGYHYKKFRDDRLSATPADDGWFEHPMDADRYGVCHMIPIAREMQDESRGPIYAKGVIDIRRAKGEQTMKEFLAAKEKKVGPL